MRVDVGHNFADNVLLERAVHWRIHPLAAAPATPAVGHDNDQRTRSTPGDRVVTKLLDRRSEYATDQARPSRPRQRTTAKPVQQIDRCIAGVLSPVSRRQIHDQGMAWWVPQQGS